MWLQTKLDAFKAWFESDGAPAHAVAAINQSVSELKTQGLSARTIKVGDVAPIFSLKDTQGFYLSSARLLEQGPLVVVFFRGVWCPYCNLELQALEDVLPELQRRNATMVAISPQAQENSLKAKTQNNLNFPILLDPGNLTADAFGIRWRQQEELIKVSKTDLGVDLSAINGDDSWTLPLPSRFVIGRDGKVLHADISIDHTQRPDPADLIAALDA